MPIKPENKGLYPKNWKKISLKVREAAGWRCQGTMQFPTCRAKHGEPHPATGSKVVLTVAHMNHNPKDCRRKNLKALCQRCHLSWDAKHHAATAKKTRHSRRADRDLFGDHFDCEVAGKGVKQF